MAKKVVLYLLIVVIVVALLVVGAILLFYKGVTSAMCENTVISSVDSPDGAYTATTFTRDCGATTKASYELSVLKKSDALQDDAGNVYISYGEFNVSWADNDKLVVSTGPGDQFKKETRYKSIQITYK